MKQPLREIKRITPTDSDLRRLYEGSAVTMVGYLPEELELYINELEENKHLIGTETWVYECTGKDLAYSFGVDVPADLNIFMIELVHMHDIPKFSVGLRFQRGYRWLDDVIDNLTPAEEE